LREPDLVVLREQVVATDVFEIQTYEVFVIAVFSAGLHWLGHLFTFGVEGNGPSSRVGIAISIGFTPC
jgi:hypothetical protein